ncbi:hypothetical protein FGO68_gene12721 [Halteria grandinella]|uniref:HNH endonuclease n=1 Tax=Halteria grandinella TaxID=5974 RepID=A0A8J8NAT4_HALGN|nr:hypothetical protein FGO68_gene12721 [Halteria grandinella]
MQCQYSGDLLTNSTTDEHIIPKKLGGRIVSNNIMTSIVNNQFSKIDNALISRYRHTLLNLNDLIPSQAKTKEMAIDIPMIEGGQFILTNEGPELRQSRGSKVKIKGEDLYLLNQDSEIPSYFSDKPNELQTIQYSDLKDENGDTYSFWNDVVSPQIDLAILKIASSSVLHLCNTMNLDNLREKCIPFSRSIYKSLSDKTHCSKCIQQHMLGFQISPFHLINTIEKQFDRVNRFTHYVAIFCNPSLRTLDAAVVLFGTEVFGVRICHNAQIPRGFIIENPILSNTEPSTRFFDPNEDFIVKNSLGKSHIESPIPLHELDITNKAIQDSMESLLAESYFFSECKSLNKFRINLTQWIRKQSIAPSPKTTIPLTIGQICQQRISLYYDNLCNPIPPEFLRTFNRFDTVLVNNDQISDNLLSDLFTAHNVALLNLSEAYGIPKLLFYRELDAELNITEAT